MFNYNVPPMRTISTNVNFLPVFPIYHRSDRDTDTEKAKSSFAFMSSWMFYMCVFHIELENFTIESFWINENKLHRIQNVYTFNYARWFEKKLICKWHSIFGAIIMFVEYVWKNLTTVWSAKKSEINNNPMSCGCII